MVTAAPFSSWYNTCRHSALQHSPFEILYGQQPTQFGIDPDQDCVIPDLADWLKNKKLVTHSTIVASGSEAHEASS